MIVVKIGGSTLGAHDTALRDVADAARAGRRMVVVHGGGAAVSAALAASGVEPRFVRGLRVTDARSLETVVAVLAGTVNKQIVAELASYGARALGLSGADAMILQAGRFDQELGYVGQIEKVDAGPLHALLDAGLVPVMAPLAIEVDGPERAQLLNTNADTAAGEIAAALGAEQLVFLTDVEGVLDAQGALLGKVSAEEARGLIAAGVAGGGMIPKLEAAARAATAGCTTRIINGTIAGALAGAIAGRRAGTTVTP